MIGEWGVKCLRLRARVRMRVRVHVRVHVYACTRVRVRVRVCACACCVLRVRVCLCACVCVCDNMPARAFPQAPTTMGRVGCSSLRVARAKGRLIGRSVGNAARLSSWPSPESCSALEVDARAQRLGTAAER